MLFIHVKSDLIQIDIKGIAVEHFKEEKIVWRLKAITGWGNPFKIYFVELFLIGLRSFRK